MSSKIKVDNIADQGNNNMLVKCGSTLTIGATGNTITLASGASQSGFGREGSVDWQTGSIKTTGFTAANGEGYFINTTSGSFTATLPGSPSAGNIVAFKDYGNSFGTNKLTIGRNGSNIGGLAEDLELNTSQQALTLVYVDGTKGWLAVSDSTTTDVPQKFVTATGGTVTTSGNFKIHTFTGPGTFTVSCGGNSAGSNTVDYLVVAGGGGSEGGEGTGGGGGGGYRESPGSASGCYTVSPRGAAPAVALPVPATAYPITVGAGGNAGPSPATGPGGAGGDSTFSSITSTGGGGGGGGGGAPGTGSNGGSGGGGGGRRQLDGTGGTGNTPPVNPAQGSDGGDTINITSPPDADAGGGGGGAVGAGADGSTNTGGAGGTGATSSINGTPTGRAGGGGGGAQGGTSPPGTGGPGNQGGGSGGNPGTSGAINTGGGGGGMNHPGACGATGGSGIVIIRYKFQ